MDTGGTRIEDGDSDVSRAETSSVSLTGASAISISTSTSTSRTGDTPLKRAGGTYPPGGDTLDLTLPNTYTQKKNQLRAHKNKSENANAGTHHGHAGDEERRVVDLYRGWG